MRILFCVLTVLLFAVPTTAQDRFDQIANKDGYISWEEFQKSMPNFTRAAFDAINTSKSGKISREEWNRFQSSHSGMSKGGELGGEAKKGSGCGCCGTSVGCGCGCADCSCGPDCGSKSSCDCKCGCSNCKCCGKNPGSMDKPLVKSPPKK